MRRGRVFIYLALILILGLAAVFLVYQRVILPRQNAGTGETGQQAEAVPTAVPETMIVFTAQSIRRGTVLTEEHLQMLPYPEDLILPTMFKQMALVVGRQAKVDLDAQIPVTANMLAEPDEQLPLTGSIAATQIPAGFVAVSIPISRLSAVSYAPRPGDHVSVIMTLAFVDLDTEYQTILPNNVAGVLAPGPAAVIGTQPITLGDGGSYDVQKIEQWSSENGPKAVAVTSQLVSNGALAWRGRSEIDPLVNELFYVVPSERQRPRLVSQTFLGDVMVLYVGTFTTMEEEELAKKAAEEAQNQPTPDPNQPPAEGEQAADQPTETAVVAPKPPDIITIVVKPQDAVTLNYLLYSGAELTLALRATGDTTVVPTEAATLQFLLDVYNLPVPAKLPYGVEPRVDDLQPPVLLNDVVPTPQP